ncbi:MAG: M23 family metallopeptidase, partial [Actinomycetota bacterium]
MSRTRALVVALAVVALAPLGGRSGAQPPEPKVFPVARSDWYSVINFRDDWHAPRMRLVGDTWQLVGVHEGNDIFAEPGTRVMAVLGGTVERVGWAFYSGWRVGIRGVDGRYWFYAHLQAFAPGLAVGSAVAAGQAIGEVGNTGYGAAPGHRDEFTYHLHLGIQKADGTWVSPYPLVQRLYGAAVDASTMS